MFILMSVTRDELSISENFCATKQEAVDAMVKDILLMTNYASLDEIIKASENDEAGFSDDEAWTETKHRWYACKNTAFRSKFIKKEKSKVGEPCTIQRLFVDTVF